MKYTQRGREKRRVRAVVMIKVVKWHLRKGEAGRIHCRRVKIEVVTSTWTPGQLETYCDPIISLTR